MRRTKLYCKKDDLIRDYDNMTCKELSVKYGFHQESVRKALRRWGIVPKHKPRRNINHNYFESVDTHNKAYVLGFLCADGSINKKTNKISFCINTKDIDVLRFIKKELESEHKITSSVYIDKRNGSTIHSTNLQMISPKLKSDLLKLGVTPYKSTYLSMPLIDEIYFYSFLCGLVDGDGSVGKTRSVVSLISTKELLKYVQERCKKDGIRWANKILPIGGEQYKIHLNRDTLKLQDKLYTDVNFFLKRKYKNFELHLHLKSNKSNNI